MRQCIGGGEHRCSTCAWVRGQEGTAAWYACPSVPTQVGAGHATLHHQCRVGRPADGAASRCSPQASGSDLEAGATSRTIAALQVRRSDANREGSIWPLSIGTHGGSRRRQGGATSGRGAGRRHNHWIAPRNSARNVSTLADNKEICAAHIVANCIVALALARRPPAGWACPPHSSDVPPPKPTQPALEPTRVLHAGSVPTTQFSASTLSPPSSRRDQSRCV